MEAFLKIEAKTRYLAESLKEPGRKVANNSNFPPERTGNGSANVVAIRDPSHGAMSRHDPKVARRIFVARPIFRVRFFLLLRLQVIHVLELHVLIIECL